MESTVKGVFNEGVEWIVKQHRDTNHKYDDILPYEFHLRMVADIGNYFADLIPINEWSRVYLALWGHDLIEDTRVTYNDVANKLGQPVAEIIYALTNEKGRTRKDRANDKYYEGIRDTPYATFVKLCDRLANVRYSKMKRSKMFKMYQNEHKEFMEKLCTFIDGSYDSLIHELNNEINA